MEEKTNNFESEIDKLKAENQNIKNSLNQVLEEYSDYRKECDEICKEYEETIQLLSQSVEKFKSENSQLNSENSKLNIEKEKIVIDKEKLAKELEKAREKNKDKIKDIEILNNKIDELHSQYKSINKNETSLKSKVVTLETDNDHYLNKIHQYEEEVTDLKDHLENTLENLITTQNEYEEYKAKKEEELERLKKILQEEKDNVKALMNKNFIQKHNGLQSNKINDTYENNEFDDLEKDEDNIERTLSWNDETFDKVRSRGRFVKYDKNNEINSDKKYTKNELEKEQEYMMENGGGRNNRAMTMAIGSYNFGELFSKLRKRKEELVQFNKRIKRDAAMLKKN